jgi:putative SOS response-associated peptidase YedK
MVGMGVLSGAMPSMPARNGSVTRSASRKASVLRGAQPATRPVTNVRNTTSPYWRGWLKREFNCLVPAVSFGRWSPCWARTPATASVTIEPILRGPLASTFGALRPPVGTKVR